MSRNRLFLLALVAGHLALAAAIPFLMQNHGASSMAWGIWTSQIGLIVLWFTLRRTPIMLRINGSLLLGQLMWNATVLGSHWTRTSQTHDARTAILTIVVTQIATMFGLGASLVAHSAAFSFLRWRLCSPVEVDDPNTARPIQFSLTQLLSGMLLICMALGTTHLNASMYLTSNETENWHFNSFATTMILGVGVLYSSVFQALTLLTLVPCVWATFSPVQSWYRLARGGVVLLAIVSIVETVVLKMAITGSEAGGIFLTVSFFNVAQCVTVHVTFLILRLAGYRLVRLERKPERVRDSANPPSNGGTATANPVVSTASVLPEN